MSAFVFLILFVSDQGKGDLLNLHVIWPFEAAFRPNDSHKGVQGDAMTSIDSLSQSTTVEECFTIATPAMWSMCIDP